MARVSEWEQTKGKPPSTGQASEQLFLPGVSQALFEAIIVAKLLNNNYLKAKLTDFCSTALGRLLQPCGQGTGGQLAEKGRYCMNT